MTSLAYDRRSIAPDRDRHRSAARRARDGRRIAPARAVGVVSFLVVLALGTSWLWALVAGVAACAACRLTLRHGDRVASLVSRDRTVSLLRRCARQAGTARSALGAAPAEARRTIGEARATIAGTRAAAAGIDQVRVRAKAVALCDTAERIVDELQRKPADVARARRFLCYYLEAAQRIVARYAQLGTRDGASAQIRPTLDKVEPALDVMASVFAEQLARLQHDDALDLDAELALLDKTARFDGLLEDPSRSVSGARPTL